MNRMIDLVSLNLGLDVVLKLMFFGILVMVMLILRNLNDTIKSANRSAESVKRTADRVGNVLTFRSAYKTIKGATKKKGEADDE